MPVRELIAVGPARTESILYWTRVGDALPTSNSAQRLDRLRMAMAGYVPDGLLARFSLAGNEEDSFDRVARSEERSGGKESGRTCRCRWSLDHKKKKHNE